MIDPRVVIAWSRTHPWATQEQVEQDLLLSRAICAIAEHPYLGEELTFRGGTALHKVHLPTPFRYSEDLDYVRTTAGGIADLTRALTETGRSLGFSVKTKITRHPKVYWRTTAASGAPIRIKVEVNTHERSPAAPPIRVEHTVESEWWTGSAKVRTFQPAELVATKIRALYQRSRGRDLFDLWLALTELNLDPDDILAAFHPYRPEAFTAAQSVANLEAKTTDPAFCDDIDALFSGRRPVGYDVGQAATLVIDKVLSRVG